MLLFLLGCAGKGADLAHDLVGILLSPDPLVLSQGEQVQLRATGLTEDRQSVDVTDVVEWKSDAPAVVQVSNALDEEGLALGRGLGRATIEARYGDVLSAPLIVTVTDAEVQRLEVRPSSLSMAVGEQAQLQATAWYSDGLQTDATSLARWVTLDGAVATVSAQGLLKATGAGSTHVEVEYGGAAASLVSVQVSGQGGGQPDLRVSAASGSISGGQLDLNVTIQNDGGGSASNFWVDVFIDRGSPSVGETGDDFEWVTWLSAGSSTNLSFSIPVSSGSHTVTVFADTNDDLDESDEDDNLFTTTVSSSSGGGSSSLADLAITYFDYLYETGYVYYAVDVKNQGGATASASFYVDVWVDRDDTPTLYEDGDAWTSLSSVAAGATVTADFLLYGVYCSWCWSWVMVDGYDVIDESNESNNVSGPLDVY